MAQQRRSPVLGSSDEGEEEGARTQEEVKPDNKSSRLDRDDERCSAICGVAERRLRRDPVRCRDVRSGVVTNTPQGMWRVNTNHLADAL